MIKLCRHQELTDQLTLHTPNGFVASVLRIKTSWGGWNQHSYVIWTPDIEPVEIHQSPGQGAGLTCASEFQYFPRICRRTSAFPACHCAQCICSLALGKVGCKSLGTCRIHALDGSRSAAALCCPWSLLRTPFTPGHSHIFVSPSPLLYITTTSLKWAS